MGSYRAKPLAYSQPAARNNLPNLHVNPEGFSTTQVITYTDRITVTVTTLDSGRLTVSHQCDAAGGRRKPLPGHVARRHARLLTSAVQGM